MKNYNKDYDNLYDTDGVNYSRVDASYAKKTKPYGKYLQLYDFYKNLSNYVQLDVLEVGSALGHASQYFKNYLGVEYSRKAIEIGKSLYGNHINLVEGDARNLPVSDSSKDLVYSINTLEHIPEPQVALDEMIRVTKIGGYLYLDPAYNCRQFTVKKLEYRKYRDLEMFDKVEKLLIPLSNSLLFRSVVAMPRRIILEIHFLLFRKPIPLFFKRLSPDFELIEVYGHTSDDDAFSSFDKHAVVLYFISRKYTVIGYNNFFKRMLCRTGPVIIQKSDRFI